MDNWCVCKDVALGNVFAQIHTQSQEDMGGK